VSKDKALAKKKDRPGSAPDAGAHVGALIESLQCIEGCTGCKDCRRLKRIGLRVADCAYRMASVERRIHTDAMKAKLVRVRATEEDWDGRA
jgi:hypothetical protein